MTMHGGRTPYDEAGALTGPARVLYAPTSTAVPTDVWDIIPAVKDGSGEYPAKTGWFDFGLAADAPSYHHARDSAGLTYQQPSGALFQQITSITRTMVVQMAHIDETVLQILENASAVASTIAASSVNHTSAEKKLYVGLYSDTPNWRIAMISYRPDGAAVVTETDGLTRPPLVARIIPLAEVATDEVVMTVGRGDPVNTPVTFTALSEPTAPAGGEHGYWIVEQAGTIT